MSKASLWVGLDDDGTVLFEWIAKDFRVGLTLTDDLSQSSWYAVSKGCDGEFDVFECGMVDDALNEARALGGGGC